MPKKNLDLAGKGVIAQHRERIANDKAYRDAALTPPLGARGKYLTNTAPTILAADRSKDAKRTEATKPQRDGHSLHPDSAETLADQA